MKVKADYYQQYFKEPEVCERVAAVCRAEVRASGRPYTTRALIAKRLQSIIAKYYKLSKESPIRLDSSWEQDPVSFIDYVIEQSGDEDARIVRKDVQADFTPENLIFMPITRGA